MWGRINTIAGQAWCGQSIFRPGKTVAASIP